MKAKGTTDILRPFIGVYGRGRSSEGQCLHTDDSSQGVGKQRRERRERERERERETEKREREKMCLVRPQNHRSLPAALLLSPPSSPTFSEPFSLPQSDTNEGTLAGEYRRKKWPPQNILRSLPFFPLFFAHSPPH